MANTTPQPTLGMAIRRKREAFRLSQAELAELAGIAQQTLSKLERGKKQVSEEAIARIAEALTNAVPGNISFLTGPPIPLKQHPAALAAWTKNRAKQLAGYKAEIARQWGSYENYGEMVKAQGQIDAQERRIEALQAEVAAQAEQITALRDLLDLKTKEVVLRDKIESSPTETSIEKPTGEH